MILSQAVFNPARIRRKLAFAQTHRGMKYRYTAYSMLLMGAPTLASGTLPAMLQGMRAASRMTVFSRMRACSYLLSNSCPQT